MKTKAWAIVLMVICTAFTSSAQILWKIGADKLRLDVISILTNWQIIFGIVLYALGAILVIFALKNGEVTILYPILTSSYIWVSLASSYFLSESMNLFKWIGIFLIIGGILMIILGTKNKEVVEFTEPV